MASRTYASIVEELRLGEDNNGELTDEETHVAELAMLEALFEVVAGAFEGPAERTEGVDKVAALFGKHAFGDAGAPTRAAFEARLREIFRVTSSNDRPLAIFPPFCEDPAIADCWQANVDKCAVCGATVDDEMFAVEDGRRVLYLHFGCFGRLIGHVRAQRA